MISPGNRSGSGVVVKLMELSLAVDAYFGGKYVHLRLGDLGGTGEGSEVAEMDCLLWITTVGAVGKMVELGVDGFGDGVGKD